KTHLLYSIKHGPATGWQLLVTPGTYQRDSEFLEYLLFQVLDTLLGGGRQGGGARPVTIVGNEIVRGLFRDMLSSLNAQQRLDLFPAPGLGRWGRRLGLGSTQAQERTQWLIDNLARPGAAPVAPGGVRRACDEAGLAADRACQAACAHVEQTAAHNTAGLM